MLRYMSQLFLITATNLQYYIDENDNGSFKSPVRMADEMISRAARRRFSSVFFSSTNLAMEFCRLL